MSKNYVKEYKGYKVPEGATHCHELGQGSVSFYRVGPPIVDRYCEPLCSADDPWNVCIGVPAASEELPEEPAQEWVDGLPPLNSEVLLSDEEGHLFSSASNEKVSIAEDEVLVVVSIGARYDNGNPVVTLMAKDSKNLQGFVTVNPEFLEPVKTQEQKDREAFIEWANKATNADGKDHTVVDLFNDLFDAGFKAPEGE